jgi:hypothetical protein
LSIIYTDRSRIERYEDCPRKRFWLYEYDSKGLEKADNLKLDARIGTRVHNGIETFFGSSETPHEAEAVALWAGREFVEDCYRVLGKPEAEQVPQLIHDIIEGGRIVTALTYAWLRHKAPRMLGDGEVLGIEKELTVDFEVGTDVVRLMARPDVIWRRHQDGAIFIRNLKTVRKADDRWREKWALDMQTLSEPLAVDEWLRSQHSADSPYASFAQCGGVIIDGLVTGEVLFDKYRGLFYHNNPLVYAWEGGDIGVAEKPVFYPRYEWSCTAPHKMGNGRRCEGGRTHKLSGVRKVAVQDRYPGGIIAWIDHLIENDVALVEEMLIELPPIIRSGYQIERWRRQVLPREAAIHNHAKQCNVEQLVGERSELLLDEHFPMHTANGNCLYPGKCAAFDLCHGSAAGDPLNSGYQIRMPNHPQEVKDAKKQDG